VPPGKDPLRSLENAPRPPERRTAFVVNDHQQSWWLLKAKDIGLCVFELALPSIEIDV
jgi:hypothetical protein